MKKKLVIFDFDGVIVDTLPLGFGLYKEVNPMMSYRDYQEMSYGNFHEGMVEAQSKGYNRPADYRERYFAGIQVLPSPLKSVLEKINKKYDLAIVSSGVEATIKNFLEKEGIFNFFFSVLGVETDKSKVVKLTTLSEKYAKNDMVYITDTLGDVLEAHEAGIKSIGVLWGLHDQETLARGNPEIIIGDPVVLEETIEKVLNG